MATIIKNTKDLKAALDTIMCAALDSTAEDIELIISDFLHLWYDDYHPVAYKRTKQFLKSCTRLQILRRGSDYYTGVYINYRDFNYILKGKDEKGNRFERPMRQEEKLGMLEYANRGVHGYYNGKDGISGVKFWDDAMDDIKRNDRLINGFCDYLKSRGFSVTFVQKGAVPF